MSGVKGSSALTAEQLKEREKKSCRDYYKRNQKAIRDRVNANYSKKKEAEGKNYKKHIKTGLVMIDATIDEVIDTYVNVDACSKDNNIPRYKIYKSLNEGVAVDGYLFKREEPKK